VTYDYYEIDDIFLYRSPAGSGVGSEALEAYGSDCRWRPLPGGVWLSEEEFLHIAKFEPRWTQIELFDAHDYPERQPVIDYGPPPPGAMTEAEFEAAALAIRSDADLAALVDEAWRRNRRPPRATLIEVGIITAKAQGREPILE
jgi:hypothetical protein